MQTKLDLSIARMVDKPWRSAVTALVLVLSLGATGCFSSLSKHSRALSIATAPVIDGATNAYRTAEDLHDLSQNYDAVLQFPMTPPKPVYNPRDIQPLLDEKGIAVRLAVLAAFQAYVQSLVDITSGVSSDPLNDAAKSTGAALSGLGNDLLPSVESTLGVATISAAAAGTTAPASISPQVRNGIETATKALAEYLVSTKIKKSLPPIIIRMDPNVDTLCQLLRSDIDILADQEIRDNDTIINLQTLFLRQNPQMNPIERREEIMKLPEIVRRQRASKYQLEALKDALDRLARTHHALARAAQDNKPESLKAQLGELAAIGSDLGQFYTSLPTQ